MRVKPLLGLGVLGGVGGSCLYGFHLLQPKNLQEYLEWQGFRLVSSSDENTWKAIKRENPSLLKEIFNKDPEITEIQKWCNGLLPVEDYQKHISSVSKICVDSVWTVEGKIIQEKGSLSGLIQSGEDEKYAVAYVFRRHISGFLDLINFYPPPKEEGKPLDEKLKEATESFKAWCTTSLTKKADEVLVANIQAFCSPKSFSTIEGLIKQNRESFLTDVGNEQELQKKYKDIENLDSWKADKPQSLAVTDLKAWCNKHKDKKFSEEGVFSEVYPKFRFRCVKGSNSDPK